MKKSTIVIVVFIFLMGCNKSKQNPGKPGTPPISSYKVAPVYYGDAGVAYSFPATIQGEQDVVIIPKVDGYLEKMYVDEGAIVKKGQLLFQLRNPQYEEAARSLTASVQIAEANVKSAQMQVNQVKPLVDKKILSTYALETNQYALESNQAALASAKANLTNAQVNLDYLTLRSPADGAVGAIPFKIGSLISSTAGNGLTTVYNTANVYAYFSINEKQLLEFIRYFNGKTQQIKLDNLQEVSLQLADGTVYPLKGKVTSSSGVVSTQTGSENCRATFPNPNGLIHQRTVQSKLIANIAINYYNLLALDKELEITLATISYLKEDISTNISLME